MSDASKHWRNKVIALIQDWMSGYGDEEPLGVVASPDVDGVLSIWLLQRYLYKNYCKIVQVIAIYDTTRLMFCDGANEADVRRALWVDHDMLDHLRCVGNHLSHYNIGVDTNDFGRHPLSFNLNHHYQQTYADSFVGWGANKRDKCPFGTAHILAQALMADELDALFDRQPYHSLFALLAHADGFWASAHDYAPSVKKWYSSAFDEAHWLSYVANPVTYSGDEERLKNHEKVITSLKNGLKGHLETKSSASGSGKTKRQMEVDFQTVNPTIRHADRWVDLRGHQSVVTSYDLDPISRTSTWLPYVNALFNLIGGAIHKQYRVLQVPNSITNVAAGDLVKTNPKKFEAPKGSDAAQRIFEQKVLEKGPAYSIAFVSSGCVRVTHNLFEQPSNNMNIDD